MKLLTQARSLLQNLFRRERVEDDLDEEVSSYVELLTQQKIKRGMSPQGALRAAKLELGGAAQVKEEVRRVRTGAGLQIVWQDLRYAARILRKNPVFTLAAVLTFGIGIGANTAVFSIANALLFRVVPAAKPDQLTFLVQRRENSSNGFSYPDFEDIRKQSSDAFDDLAATRDFQKDGLSLNGRSQNIWTCYVTSNFFKLMGVRPALGNLIVPDPDNLPGSNPVLVLGYSFWQTRLGGNPNVIGQQVAINGHQVTIIGVTPKGFHGPSNLEDTQGFLPLGLAETFGSDAARNQLSDRERASLLVLGRLKDDASLARARSVLAVIADRLARQYPATHKSLVLRPVPLGAGFINSTGENPLGITAALFLTLAGLVLLLAAANVASLLLVRALARSREIGVRSALGATRSRLVRHVLTETLVLALLGCAAGLVMGLVASHALGSMPLQTDYPIVLDFHFDWRVFGYAVAAALLVAIAGGFAPARRVSRVDLNDVIRDSSRNASPRRQRLRTVLVIGQVAGSLMLLIVAGLFLRSLRNVQHTDLGFDSSHVTNLTVDVHQAGYDEIRGRTFFKQLLERAQSLPGVESASLASTAPFGLEEYGTPIKVEGFQQQPGQPTSAAGYDAISPAYFKTLRIPILRGRGILESDSQNLPRVALINQAMAERYWPGKDSIGRTFTRDDDPKHPLQVVGIVRNSRVADLTDAIGPFFYVPQVQSYASKQTLLIRVAASAATSTTSQAAVDTVRSLEPAMPVSDVQTMDQVMQGLNGFFIYRLAAYVAGMLGSLGLVLAVVGVYGVISYSAAQRTYEIGIRMAMGAQPGQVLRLILRQGFFIVGLGIAIGVGAALAMGQVVRGFLVGVGGADPATYLFVSMSLAMVGLGACIVPARRAAKVDPMIALRNE